jgi:hypothetical protein
MFRRKESRGGCSPWILGRGRINGPANGKSQSLVSMHEAAKHGCRVDTYPFKVQTEHVGGLSKGQESKRHQRRHEPTKIGC